MQTLNLIARLLWAAGFGMNAALLLVLLWKGRWRIVPWFTAWIGFAFVTTIVLYLGHTYGSVALYRALYWSAAFIDVLLQLTVILEVSSMVFKRGESWVGNARPKLVWSAIAVVLVALFLALKITPAAETTRDALYSRASLFVTILVTGLFTAVMGISQQVGVSWRNILIREGPGFLLLNLVSFVTDTLHAYWRTAEHFGDLEHVRMGVYLATLGYWIVVFWLPERAQAVVDEDTKKRLRDLRSRLEYESPK